VLLFRRGIWGTARHLLDRVRERRRAREAGEPEAVPEREPVASG
jgi:hypothetical protein